jgi:predicted peptidase
VPVCGAVLAPRAVRASLFVESVANEADPYAAIAERLKATPIWLFHGALDDVVLPADDRKLKAAFDAAGAGDVRYTEYPQGNHNAWDATYANAAMWEWLFAQKR